MEDLKRCTTCKIVKEKTKFYKNRSKPDGYSSICKSCQYESTKKYNKRVSDFRKLCRENHVEFLDLPAARNTRLLIPVYEAYEKHALEAPGEPYEHPIKYKLGSRPIKEGLVFKGDYLYIRTKKGVMEKRIDLCTPDTLGKLLANEGIEVLEKEGDH